MKRATLVCVAAVCLGLSTARPAHASLGGIFDYIGGLSGPGPFQGYVGYLDVLCREAERGDATDKALESGGRVQRQRNLLCKGDLRVARESYGFLVGGYHTDRLPDAYKYTKDKESLSPDITAITVGLTFKTTLPFVKSQSWLRSVDIGAEVGTLIFRSSPRFETFAVPVIEVPRVVVRPLAPIACSRNNKVCPSRWTRWDLLEVTVGTRIIGGVTSEEFGAQPGVESGRHIMLMAGAGVSYKF